MLALRSPIYGLCGINHESNQHPHQFPCNRLAYLDHLAKILCYGPRLGYAADLRIANNRETLRYKRVCIERLL